MFIIKIKKFTMDATICIYKKKLDFQKNNFGNSLIYNILKIL